MGVQVSHLQRKIAAAMARLKQQQNLYEAVRSDRNIYSKNLIETQDVIKGMKQRFKIMNHQIEQLKDEITVMDHSLVRRFRLGPVILFVCDELILLKYATPHSDLPSCMMMVREQHSDEFFYNQRFYGTTERRPINTFFDDPPRHRWASLL